MGCVKVRLRVSEGIKCSKCFTEAKDLCVCVFL